MHSSDPGKSLRVLSATPCERTLWARLRWGDGEALVSIYRQHTDHFYRFRVHFCSDPDRTGNGLRDLLGDLRRERAYPSGGKTHIGYDLSGIRRKQSGAVSTDSEAHHDAIKWDRTIGLGAGTFQNNTFLSKIYAHHGIICT